MIIKTFEFNPICENTYLIYDETKEAVIIDAGTFFPEEETELITYIDQNGLMVKHLLNTHLHFDHIFGNVFIEKKLGLITKAHKADQFLLDGLPAQMRMFGMGEPAGVPQIGAYIDENDTIEFGHQQFSILHVPGHSPGSIVFYNKNAGCAFVGDVLFKSSIGRTDLAGGNHRELITGIQDKLMTLPPDTVIYPGHGPTTTIEAEKRNNPYL